MSSLLGVLSRHLHPLFTCKNCPSILHRLLVSSLSGDFPGHLCGSSHFFTCKIIPFILCHVLVSSVLGILSGRLHPPSRAKKITQPCIVSWCRWHQVVFQIIFILLHMQKMSLHLPSSLRVLSVPLVCQPPSSILCHPLLVSLALGVLPGHLCPPAGPGHLPPLRTIFSVLGVGCPCWVGHLQASSCASHLDPSCIILS